MQESAFLFIQNQQLLMQVIPLTGKAWVLDWDSENPESVLGSVGNWVQIYYT